MENNNTNSWISAILRLAVASLFLAAAVGKYQTGINGVVQYFQTTFKDAWLPPLLVEFHARLTPVIETIIPLWLITGIRLKAGWIITTLFAVSLAFGMAVVRQYGTAANNYFYVLLCLAGLYFSQFDKWNFDAWFKLAKRREPRA